MSNNRDDIHRARAEMSDDDRREFDKGVGFAHHYGMGPRGLKALAKKFLGESQVELPTHEVVVDVDAADQRIIMLHGEKARGVSTYEMGRGPELMEVGWLTYQTVMGYNRVGEYGLTWVGWLEKYSSYAKREGEGEGEGTPIFQQTIVEELMRADADDRAQGTWLGLDGWANEFEDDGEGF